MWRFVRPSVAIVLLSTLQLAAEDRIYSIALTLKDDGLERTFSGWDDYGPDNANGRLPDDELAKLSKLYAERLSGPEELRQKFRGVFAKNMPRDVGGAGGFRRIATPLGTAYWYSERFRGNDDVDAELYDLRAAADRLSDFIVGWFETQLQDSPHRETIQRFARQQLRQDLRKLAMSIWLANCTAGDILDGDERETADERRSTELVQRMMLYCVEHGYLEPEEAVSVVGMVEQHTGPQDMFRLIRRGLARGCKLDVREADEVFACLSDSDVIEQTVKDYLSTTPEYARLLKQNGIAKDAPKNELPDANEVLEPLFEKAFGMNRTHIECVVWLSLHTTVRPYQTNGEYDPSDGTVQWSKVVRPIGLPTFCYAVWADPDEMFQKQHFGSTAFDEDALSQFASLFERLSELQRTKFTAHLRKLKPNDKLGEQLREFHLPEEADDEAKRIVEQLLELLTERV